MQKWEYCAVVGLVRIGEFDGMIPSYPTFSHFTLSGMQVTSLKSRNEAHHVAQLIAQLGEDGWEMVGTFQASEGVHGIYFKRPKL